MDQEYPIRVLHRGMSYNRGGIESYLINYYRHMDRELVQFDFIVPEGMVIAFEDEIKTMGGCIYKEIVGIKKNPIKGLFYDRKFFKNHSEIQILHINDCSAANLRLMKTAKKCGVQTRILHSHNNDYLVPLRKRQLFVEKLNKKNLDKIATDLFACSDDAGRFMFGDSSFKIVRNAVEVEKYLYSSDKRASYRNEWGIPDNVNVLGCVARFDYQKNHDYLLDVFAEYKRIDEKAILILIGDGPLRNEIENKINVLGLSNSVKLLGTRADVSELLNAFDLFILPSRSEGLGIVFVEAQINGLGCVTSDNVPKEVNILDKIEYLALDAGAEIWAKQIDKIKKNMKADRTIDIQRVRDAGYDIKIEAKKLQDFYLSKIRKG